MKEYNIPKTIIRISIRFGAFSLVKDFWKLWIGGVWWWCARVLGLSLWLILCLCQRTLPSGAYKPYEIQSILRVVFVNCRAISRMDIKGSCHGPYRMHVLQDWQKY